MTTIGSQRRGPHNTLLYDPSCRTVMEGSVLHHTISCEAGGNKDLQAEISGISPTDGGLNDMFGIIRFIQNWIRTSFKPIVWTFQSTVYLLPRPSVFGNTVLVTTLTQSYTAND